MSWRGMWHVGNPAAALFPEMKKALMEKWDAAVEKGSRLTQIWICSNTRHLDDDVTMSVLGARLVARVAATPAVAAAPASSSSAGSDGGGSGGGGAGSGGAGSARGDNGGDGGGV